MFQEKNLDIKISFNKEFSFEIDDEDDFIESQKNTPRWFKGVSI